MNAKEWYKEYEKKEWTKVRGHLAKQSTSLGYGLYPFRLASREVVRKADYDSKRGTRSTVYINNETDVQFDYSYRVIRFFDMSDPVDYKDYWEGRARTKALFVKTFYGRK